MAFGPGPLDASRMPSASFAELLRRLAEEHELEVRAAREGAEFQRAVSSGSAATLEGSTAPGATDPQRSGSLEGIAREARPRLDVPTLAVAGAKLPPASAWRGRFEVRKGLAPLELPAGFMGPVEAGSATSRPSRASRHSGRSRRSGSRRTPSTAAGERASGAVVTNPQSQESVPTHEKSQSCPARAVDDPKFDMCVAVVVCLNAVVLGLQINHEAISDSPGKLYEVLEYVFSCLFSLELGLRVFVRRSAICSKSERGWLGFDTLLVTISWFDIIVTEMSGNSIQNASLMSILKIARMARIMRIIRMVRFLTNIRTMAVMIWGSMLSLFWLFVLLAAVMYAFAILLTSGATEWLKPAAAEAPVDHELYEEVRTSFGDIMSTMYTLYLAMCGGVSWGEPASKALVMGRGYFGLFLYYIFFTFFSILNIVTGVFVDSAIQLAESDRSMAIVKAMKAKEGLQQSLRELMTEMDTDDSGFISHDEWRAAMKDQQTRVVMDVLGISSRETEELFDMLDTSGDGLVEISEFLEGMTVLKGHARSVDMHRVIAQNKRILALLEPKEE